MIPSKIFSIGFSASRRHGRTTRAVLGSGILISRDGEILTSYHVVRSADTIKVKLADHSEHEARLIGRTIAPTGIDQDSPVGRQFAVSPGFGNSSQLKSAIG